MARSLDRLGPATPAGMPRRVRHGGLGSPAGSAAIGSNEIAGLALGTSIQIPASPPAPAPAPDQGRGPPRGRARIVQAARSGPGRAQSAGCRGEDSFPKSGPMGTAQVEAVVVGAGIAGLA